MPTPIGAVSYLDGAFPEEWRHNAACDPITAELFFSIEQKDIARAIEICGGCPVARQCMEWAAQHQPDGIYAGIRW